MFRNLVAVVLFCAPLALVACDQPIELTEPCVTDLDCPSGICLGGVCGATLGDTEGATDADAGDEDTTADDVTGDALSDVPEDAADADVETPDTDPVDPDAPNACGGEGSLENPPGTPCGLCGAGEWVCSGPTTTVCDAPPVEVLNACGGCDDLSGTPGEACGACGDGEWACDGTEAVMCVGTHTNACGGCTALEREPGDPCGECGGGTLECAGTESLACADTGELNDCGGCGALSGAVGAPCGTCGSGQWACGGEDVVCVGDAGPSALNACGGCDTLSGTLGGGCGTCNSGELVCAGTDALRCADDAGQSALNACGGCNTLPGTLGGGCGMCNSGELVCRGTDALACEGDLGEASLNGCGGCNPLPTLGQTCSGSGVVTCSGGTFVCDGTNAVQCECAPRVGCGNGVWEWELGEECDDGNLAAGDGCDPGCAVEDEPDEDHTCDNPFLMPRSGVVRFDTCDLNDDTQPSGHTGGCSAARDGQDAIMEFTLPVRSRVTIGARDDDNRAAIDTRVYVRSACAIITELGCSDDVLCRDATVHTRNCLSNGSTRVQPRESLLSLDLDAGTYTLVLDTQVGRAGGVNWQCGEVLVYMISEPL